MDNLEKIDDEIYDFWNGLRSKIRNSISDEIKTNIFDEIKTGFMDYIFSNIKIRMDITICVNVLGIVLNTIQKNIVMENNHPIKSFIKEIL